jgi:hypothetical protein
MGRMEDHHGPIIYQPPDAHERAYLNRTAKEDSLARNRTGNIINGQGQSCHPGRVPARAPAAPCALRPRARAAPRMSCAISW